MRHGVRLAGERVGARRDRLGRRHHAVHADEPDVRLHVLEIHEVEDRIPDGLRVHDEQIDEAAHRDPEPLIGERPHRCSLHDERLHQLLTARVVLPVIGVNRHLLARSCRPPDRLGLPHRPPRLRLRRRRKPRATRAPWAARATVKRGGVTCGRPLEQVAYRRHGWVTDASDRATCHRRVIESDESHTARRVHCLRRKPGEGHESAAGVTVADASGQSRLHADSSPLAPASS